MKKCFECCALVQETPPTHGHEIERVGPKGTRIACLYRLLVAQVLGKMATVRTRRNASSGSYRPGFYRALNDSSTVTSADLSSRDSPESLIIMPINYHPIVFW